MTQLGRLTSRLGKRERYIYICIKVSWSFYSSALESLQIRVSFIDLEPPQIQFSLIALKSLQIVFFDSFEIVADPFFFF